MAGLTCEHCGNPTRRTIQQPNRDLWCPACHEDRVREGVQGSHAVFRDEIPGGITVENYGRHPITFPSHSARRAYMKAHGLREKEKFCPMPGTDRDPQGIPNPMGYLDPQTLKNAEALLMRNGQQETFRPESVMRLSTGTLSREEAIQMQEESRYGKN